MNRTDATLSAAERADAICDQFEAAWRAGKKPEIDDYLASVDESQRDSLRIALKDIRDELMKSGETSITRSSVRNSPNPEPLDDSLDVPHSIGRFQIRGLLGQGAFGKVYRGFDQHLGREVAIKVPRQMAVSTDSDREKFLKEARAAATINHPNVCQIYEVGEDAGRPYIVMALVPGQSLSDTIRTLKTPLSEKQIAIIIRKAALALAAAHDKGIIHRDLKTANIMFDRERKDIVVMDFGLARGPMIADGRATQSGVIMGTPAYMSPEQARGDARNAGPASDVYSLGVILYELLTNRRPFLGTATEVIGKILHVEPEAPGTIKAGIDPRLDAICLKAMAKDTAKRYANMKELVAAIDLVLRNPKPVGPSAETARAEETRDDASISKDKANLSEVFAVLSMERKVARAETAEVVNAAIAKHKTPRWIFIAIGVLLFGVLGAAGVIFFTKSDKVKVTIELSEVDLKDKTLSFFLDEKPIGADALSKPMELKPGNYVLTAKRGDVIVKRLLITVSGGKQPGFKVKDITPEGDPIGQTENDLAKWQGKWRCIGEKSLMRTMNDEELKIMNKIMEIKDDQLKIERTFKEVRGSYNGQLKLDSSQNPKHFDMVGTGPGGNKVQLSGVYELDGKRLRIIYRNTIAFPELGRAGWDDALKQAVWLEFERDNGFEDGFASLFTGKDLTGWKTHADQPGGWTVEDGLLTARSKSSHHLFSENAGYENFHLKVECRTNRFGNSGIYFRAPFTLNRVGKNQIRFPTDGYEAQILHEFPNPVNTLTGSIRTSGKILAPMATCAIKPDEWFTMEVIANGKRLIVKVNNVETANVIDDAFTRGHLILQATSDTSTNVETVVQFRNILIKEMKEEPKVDHDRKAAEWIQSIGGSGKIRIEGESEDMTFEKNTSLPDKPFRLVYIYLFIFGPVTEDDAMRYLKPLRHVRQLDLEVGANPKLSSLAFLEGWSDLRILNLGGGLNRANVNRILESCPDLESIQFSGYGRQTFLLEKFADLKKLKNINFFYSHFHDDDFTALGKFPALKSIHFGKSKETEDQLDILKKANPEIRISRAP